MGNKNFKDMYIMIDQYSNNISFQVLYGNFVSKERAKKYDGELNSVGISTVGLADFLNGY